MYKKFFLVVMVIVLSSAIVGCSDKGDKSQEVEKVEIPSIPVQKDESVAEGERLEKEEERSFKIGVIGPETGEGSEYGLKVLDGVMMASRKINAQGGIGGQEIAVLHYDNQGDAELTDQIMHRIIQEKAVAIISAPTGWSTFAPTYLANSSRTIFVSVGSRRRIEKSGPYLFRNALPDEIAADECIKYATEELGYKDYVLVTASDIDYSLDLSNQFRKAVAKHGGRIVVVADTYDTFSGETNFKGVIDAIKESSETAQAMIYTGDTEGGVHLALEAGKSGLELPIIGGEDLFTKKYLKEGGEAIRGGLLYTTFSPDDHSPGTVEFVEGYKKEKGSDPDRFVALAYDTFMLLGEAIKKAGSTQPSKVREALMNIKDFEGVTGESGFTSEGEPVKHPFIYRVEKGERGEQFVLVRERES